MSGRREISLLPWMRVLFALLLAVCISGAPRAIAAGIVGDEPPCCPDGDPDVDQGHDGDDDDCSPLCATGACAKVMPSVPTPQALLVTGFDEQLVPDAVDERPAEPVPDGHGADVFHPPRR